MQEYIIPGVLLPGVIWLVSRVVSHDKEIATAAERISEIKEDVREVSDDIGRVETKVDSLRDYLMRKNGDK